MEPITFQTTGSAKIRIATIGGRLQIRGWEATSVEVRGGMNPSASLGVYGDLSAKSENGEIRISSSGDCQLFAPIGSQIEANSVGADTSVLGVTGDLLLRTVGGNLRLRDVGLASVETVGGDLLARNLAGKLSVDRLGGDAIIDEVQSDVRLRTVGGNLRLSRVGGLVEAMAGGDARISLKPQGTSRSTVQAGGDLSCTLPETTSARLLLSAGGDLRLAVPVEAVTTPTGCEVKLGQGQATVELSAGGDLFVRTGIEGDEAVASDLGGAIAARVGAEIEAQMVEIEGRFGGIVDKLGFFDSERIGRKIRESIAKAQRKAARAQMRAAKMRAEVGPTGPVSASSGEERMTILRMLEEGKLNVEQAENLLQALESGS